MAPITRSQTKLKTKQAPEPVAILSVPSTKCKTRRGSAFNGTAAPHHRLRNHPQATRAKASMVPQESNQETPCGDVRSSGSSSATMKLDWAKGLAIGMLSEHRGYMVGAAISNLNPSPLPKSMQALRLQNFSANHRQPRKDSAAALPETLLSPRGLGSEDAGGAVSLDGQALGKHLDSRGLGRTHGTDARQHGARERSWDSQTGPQSSPTGNLEILEGSLLSIIPIWAAWCPGRDPGDGQGEDPTKLPAFPVVPP
ncbi:hypothetical protein CPB86DRAFT_820324 [Serendipita vermifera]|nr:hypothetical protein CPB86DRAFT_820324 [Serendipita vermifera]